MPQLAQRRPVFWPALGPAANDDVIKHVNLQQLNTNDGYRKAVHGNLVDTLSLGVGIVFRDEVHPLIGIEVSTKTLQSYRTVLPRDCSLVHLQIKGIQSWVARSRLAISGVGAIRRKWELSEAA